MNLIRFDMFETVYVQFNMEILMKKFYAGLDIYIFKRFYLPLRLDFPVILLRFMDLKDPLLDTIL